MPLSRPWAECSHAEYLDHLAAWAERQAIENPDGLQQLAAEAEDRKNPPDDLAGFEPWAGESSDSDAGTTAGTAPPPPLGLRREVNSTVGRYLVAAARVDAAFEVLLTDLATTARELRNDWRGRGAERAAAVETKHRMVARRQQAVRHCMVDDASVQVFRCTCCGGRKLGEPMSCNHRTCPRCVRKLRRANTAKAITLLDLVDERRRAACRAPARWRLLTLTMPSLPQFAPARRLVGRAWGRLLRTTLWTNNVGACVAAFECTHTRAGWHVHVHALVDAFLPRDRVVRQWQLATLRELVADARETGACWWPHEPLGRDSVAVLQRLAFLARTAPTSRADADGDLVNVELRDLLDDAMRDWARRLRKRELRAEDFRVRRLRALRRCRQLLAMLPTGAGQNIKEPHGGRAAVVSELAKYLGKDLGSAGVAMDDATDIDFGVAGTPERLAEFMAGTFRWRALRSYGDAYAAELRDRCAMVCDECDTPTMTHAERVHMPRHVHEAHRIEQAARRAARREAAARATPGQQFDAVMRERERQRQRPEVAPPPKPPAPVRVRRLPWQVPAPPSDIPAGRLRDLLADMHARTMATR